MSFKQVFAGALSVAAVLASSSASSQTHPASGATKPATAVAKQQASGPDAIFNRWDKDRNKSISIDEFRAGWQEVQNALVLRQLHDNFVAMDLDKSGFLESAEYANLELIKKAGSAAPMMSAFDTDKNQRLDFKEYVGLVSAMMRNKQ